MSAFGVHVMFRCRDLALTGSGRLFVVITACCGSLLFLGLAMTPRMPGPVGVMLTLFGVPIFSLLFGLAVVGEATGSGRSYRGIVHPMPTLPIGRASRASAEALAGYVVILPLVATGLLLVSAAAPGVQFVGETVGIGIAVGLVVSLPVVLSVIMPVADDLQLLLQPFVVAAVLAIALQLGFSFAIAVGILTTLFLLLLSRGSSRSSAPAAYASNRPERTLQASATDVERPVRPAPIETPASETRPAVRVARKATPRKGGYRRPLPPLVRLRRDVLLGGLALGVPYLGFSIVMRYLALRFDSLPFGDTLRYSPAWLATLLLWTPLGLNVLRNSDFVRGGFLRAAVVLPVPRISLLRAIYLHVVQVGVVVVLATVVPVWLSHPGSLDFLESTETLWVLVWFPPIGGIMVAIAAGEQRRAVETTLFAIGATYAALGLYPDGTFVRPLADAGFYPVSIGVQTIVFLVVFGTLYFLASVPPLLYLRERNAR